MNWTPADSSNIEATAHDPASNTLHIKFKGGNVYSYENVTPEQHREMLKAKSIGQHFNVRIKANPKAHPFRKVLPEKK